MAARRPPAPKAAGTGGPAAILQRFAGFMSDSGGIDSWLMQKAPHAVIERLEVLDAQPLTRSQLNQLLVLSHEAGLSDGFFEYYWLSAPEGHPYDVRSVEGFDDRLIDTSALTSLEQLRWGLYRFYVDALLYFGNVRSAYRRLRELELQELVDFFTTHRFDTHALGRRGEPLRLCEISKDDRYLISEMACKSFDSAHGESDIRKALFVAYREHVRKGGGPVTVRQLLDGSIVHENYADRQQQLLFAADDMLDADVETVQALEGQIHAVAEKFQRAREAALENTRLYLSMVEDLDVYVATSMRTRGDFRDMASFCEQVFDDPRLRALSVRYFDPTMSAAAGHEDKGLIECLMVKCAKVLVYFAGAKESFGKDAEAAMALSLGNPVIFYCDEEQRQRFYRDVHPLSRLIDFSTGVAVGAMVATRVEDVSELIARVLHNEMQYEIDQPRPGYLRLKERLTGSVVRLQTNDVLLRETFWNYYHRAPTSPVA